jgi:spore maturation protein A
MDMIMSKIWAAFLLVSILCSAVTGTGAQLAGAVLAGAQAGLELAFSMAGAVCLWMGVSRLMEALGITDSLAGLLSPLLRRLFPSTRKDPALAREVSANICANLLGLGNAATPMGIRSVQRMVDPQRPGFATDEMCRLIVLNTASIQLIPANVAAVRSALGCASPFDILPMVWITSLCSAALGLTAAALLGKAGKW